MGKNGKIIVIEGIDGSGKETQSRLLNEYVNNILNKPCKLVSFPNYSNESSFGIRQYLQGNLYNDKDKSLNIRAISSLYSHDRYLTFFNKDEEGKCLYEFYKDGGIIICDRYTQSNIIHQSFNLPNKGDQLDYIVWLEKYEYRYLGLPKPNAVIYLDLHPEVAIENIKKRNGFRDIHENIEHLRKSYNNLIENRIELDFMFFDWDFIDCLNENNEMFPIDEIQETIQMIARRVILQK